WRARFTMGRRRASASGASSVNEGEKSMNGDWRKWLFYIAALYDALLGAAFVFFWRAIFRHFAITPPNHPGYVQFPGLLLLIFAWMFCRIARDPVANRGLIVYGIAL